MRSLCGSHDVRLDAIDWFIVHQANERITRRVREALGVPEVKIPANIARYGNTSSATIPILLDELLTLDLSPPQRGYVLGILVRLRQLMVSVEDAGALADALRAGPA